MKQIFVRSLPQALNSTKPESQRKMKAIIFDTETTGLIKNRKIPLDKQPEIIEFYGCLVDLKAKTKKGQILAELEILIRPNNKKLDDAITKITGLEYDRDLKDKKSFPQVASTIKNFMGLADIWIAHNASFDLEMLEIEFERIGQSIKPKDKIICTVEQTMSLKGYRLNLAALYEHLFKEKMGTAHRAKVDVMNLKDCCFALYKMGAF